MKNILLITHKLARGGSERVLLNIANALMREGYRVHLVSVQQKQDIAVDPKIILHRGIEISWWRMKRLLEWRLCRFIKRLDRKEKFAFVISNFVTRKHWLPQRIETKTYYYLHFDYAYHWQKVLAQSPRKIAKMQRRIKGFFHNRHVIAVSKGAAKTLTNVFKVTPKTLTILYNFFDFDTIRQQATLPNTITLPETYIIHVARFDLEQKRQDLLLEAMREIEGIPLVMLTDKPQALRQLVNAYDCQHKVRICSFNDNPYPLIAKAKLSVLCSDFEGFGNVIVESMICGTPVVATDCPSGPSEILTGQLADYLVPCGNPELLATTIKKALADNINITSDRLRPFDQAVGVQQLLAMMGANSK